jgi:hypothetical protein
LLQNHDNLPIIERCLSAFMAIFGIYPRICEDCGLTTKDEQELAEHSAKEHQRLCSAFEEVEKKRRLQGHKLDLQSMESICMNVADAIANLAVLKKEMIISGQRIMA